MGFRYEYKLNGVDITEYVSIGQSLVEKLQEPLDEGTTKLPFTMRGYEYEMRGLMQITSVDDNDVEKSFALIIHSDEVEPSSKYGEYVHNINISEYTHKYDNYVFHTLTITKPTKNERLATFEVVSNINQQPSEAEMFKNISYKQPSLEVKEVYDLGEVVFKKVPPALQYLYGNNLWDERQVYLKTSASGNTQQNIVQGDVTFNFTERGYYTITMVVDYFDEVLNQSVLVDFIKYTIRVIDNRFITVKRVLEVIRDIKPLESLLYHGATRLFDIDEDIIGFLDTVEIPQQFIQKATMRQVLNSVFLYVNAISRAKFNGVDVRDIMSMDEFNKKGNDITLEELADFKSNQDAYRLFNRGISWLEQALPDDLENASIKTPAENLFKTIRSKDIQLREDNKALKLERDIYEMKKFEVILPVVNITGTTPAFNLTFTDFKLDLTSRMFDKSEYDLKLITTNFPTYTPKNIWQTRVGFRENKAGVLFWQKNTNMIDLSPTFGEVIQTTLIELAITEQLNEWFTLNPQFSGEEFRQSVAITWNKLFETLRFNVEYITLENITIQTEREDLSVSKYYTEGRINQEDKRINTMLMSRKIYGDIQRSGVPNITVKKYITDFSQLIGLGDKTEDGYVVVDRKWEFHNEYIAMTYNFVKDHNRLSERINIDTHYRAFEIPVSNQVFERQETYSDYVFIASPNSPITEQYTKLRGTKFIELLFGVLRNDWLDENTNGKTKVTLAYVRTDGMAEFYDDGSYRYGIATPVTSNGVKQGLSFTFGFENNQIAGDAIETIGENKYNKAIRYTNQDASFRNLWFALSRVYENPDDNWNLQQRLDNYPLIRTNNTQGFGSSFNNYIQCGPMVETDAGHDALVIIKDPSQSIKINSQVTIMSYKYLEYIIGQYFYTRNFLVENPLEVRGVVIGEPKYIHLYTDGTRYGKFEDLKVKSGWVARVEVTSSNLVYNDTTRTWSFIIGPWGSNVTSWAIGDEDDNLYLACNKNYKGFSSFKLHFRDDMLEIGNKPYAILPENVIITLESDLSISMVYNAQVYQGNVITGNLEYSTHIELGYDADHTIEETLELSVVITNGVAYAESYSKEITSEIDIILGDDVGYEVVTLLEIEGSITLGVTYSVNVSREIESSIEVVEGKDSWETIDIDLGFTPTITLGQVYNVTLSKAIVSNITLDKNAYKWISGGTQPVGINQCQSMDDVGNVRCNSSISCSWVLQSTYFSSTDDTQLAQCSQSATRTVCLDLGGTYSCRIETGNETITYTNCETCEVF